ncbi:pyruvate/2-oxoglutarate dehydrogenase complex dihydrolipoamide dehydrogenase (E3) component [Paraburkholderia sp. BL6669N2]|uniref:FAD-dependent oxidoreductase n=1 Tax=Paraburkholderia sp. BL6669N2 TaxID=1938807 RepID=UPI000E287912|nr:FAD-dependent oxidoreductase [Paraburkholderia sp. BL6669N2]REG49578.1 pyruvate/2-oxoglutarate dehydrogenase complex dihydrolipoamide dehydrogenase (E3) component [Paraburkholderia sp. BL6669N2]
MATTEHFEYVFLGGGKGGKSLAMDLARAGKHVAVIERGMIGGSCINVACIPTKALIQVARITHAANELARLSGNAAQAAPDMKIVRERVRSVVDGMVQVNLSAFHASGLELIIGDGRFVAPRVLEVHLPDGQRRVIEADHAFVNTGTTAAVPDIEGLREAAPLTHTEALQLEVLPEKLVVLGGGYIGLELAQAFHRLGSRVTVLQDGPRIATREDPDVTDAIEKSLTHEGIDIRTNVKAVRIEGHSGQEVKIILADGSAVNGTHILVAAGRTPNTRNIGLAAAGVEVDSRGFIVTDERLATTAERTWAIGEVAGTPMFTHASFDDYRVLKSVLDGGSRTKTDRVIPYALFIEPELGRIGINETEANARGIPFRVASLSMAAVPRARTNGETDGFMKILVSSSSDEILGFTMLGTNAGEVVSTVQMAMLGKLPYTVVRDAVIAHPTITEGLNLLLAKVEARHSR